MLVTELGHRVDRSLRHRLVIKSPAEQAAVERLRCALVSGLQVHPVRCPLQIGSACWHDVLLRVLGGGHVVGCLGRDWPAWPGRLRGAAGEGDQPVTVRAMPSTCPETSAETVTCWPVACAKS